MNSNAGRHGTFSCSKSQFQRSSAILRARKSIIATTFIEEYKLFLKEFDIPCDEICLFRKLI